MALNMLRTEATKLSIIGKQKRCLMNPQHLEKAFLPRLCSSTK